MKTGWHVLVQIGPDPTNVEDIQVEAISGTDAVRVAWLVITEDCVPAWKEEAPGVIDETDCRIIGVYPGPIG